MMLGFVQSHERDPRGAPCGNLQLNLLSLAQDCQWAFQMARRKSVGLEPSPSQPGRKRGQSLKVLPWLMSNCVV